MLRSGAQLVGFPGQACRRKRGSGRRPLLPAPLTAPASPAPLSFPHVAGLGALSPRKPPQRRGEQPALVKEELGREGPAPTRQDRQPRLRLRLDPEVLRLLGKQDGNSRPQGPSYSEAPALSLRSSCQSQGGISPGPLPPGGGEQLPAGRSTNRELVPLCPQRSHCPRTHGFSHGDPFYTAGRQDSHVPKQPSVSSQDHSGSRPCALGQRSSPRPQRRSWRADVIHLCPQCLDSTETPGPAQVAQGTSGVPGHGWELRPEKPIPPGPCPESPTPWGARVSVLPLVW